MLDRIEEGGGQRPQLEAACHLLAYLTDALHSGAGDDAIPTGGLPVLSWESPADLSLDNEWPDDQQDEEDTSADDSVSIFFMMFSIIVWTLFLNVSYFDLGRGFDATY